MLSVFVSCIAPFTPDFIHCLHYVPNKPFINSGLLRHLLLIVTFPNPKHCHKSVVAAAFL